MKAKVLNGEVGVGDTIAYATRSGSYQEMNIATVTEVIEKPHAWKDETVSVLKVSVTQSSGYPRGMDSYNTTVSVLDRVVKLASAEPARQELSCTSASTQLSGRASTRYSSAAMRMGARIGFTS